MEHCLHIIWLETKAVMQLFTVNSKTAYAQRRKRMVIYLFVNI